MSSKGSLLTFLACGLLFYLAAEPATGLEAVCDASLMGNTDSEMAYKLRGGRCEGIYRLEVGSLEVRLESLTESFTSFDATSSQPLEIAWSAPPEAGDGQVHLEANALLPRTFYRMDAVVAALSSGFQWPCNLLSRQGYGRDDLGIFGWWKASGPQAERVYLPLRVAQGGKPERTGTYELAFTPRRRLEEVFVSVYPSSAMGEPSGPPQWADQALEYGQYLAGHPIYVDLPQLTHGGYYRVEIKLVFSGEGSHSDYFVIYHEESSR